MFRASLPASLRITFQLILVTLEKGSLLTSKGFAVQECAKLLAYCSFSIKARLMDHQALKDIRMALLDGIAMMKLQIEQQNPSKDARKAYDNSFKYLERCSSRLEKLAKKNERQQHKSNNLLNQGKRNRKH